MTIEQKKNDTSELSEDIEVLSPGQMLQDARLLKGLSQEQIAIRLKLRVSLIADMEADNFDVDIPNTFLKGYLKNYARLVGISESTIISAYQHLFDAEEQRAELQSFSRRLNRQNQDNRLITFSYLVGFALIALTVVWYLQNQKSTELYLEQSEAQRASQHIQHAASESKLLERKPKLEPVLAEENTTDAQPLASEPSAVKPLTTAAQDVEPKVQAPKVITSNVVEPTTPAVVQAPEPEVKIVEQSTADVVLTNPAQTVQLNFTEDCWIEVRDANDKVLRTGIQKSGSQLDLSGEAPFKLVLGTVKGVSVVYQNEQVNLSAYPEGRVARLTLAKP